MAVEALLRKRTGECRVGQDEVLVVVDWYVGREGGSGLETVEDWLGEGSEEAGVAIGEGGCDEIEGVEEAREEGLEVDGSMVDGSGKHGRRVVGVAQKRGWSNELDAMFGAGEGDESERRGEVAGVVVEEYGDGVVVRHALTGADSHGMLVDVVEGVGGSYTVG